MSQRAPLVLMMAGGTGGHVFPALAVAQELLERGCRVEWVGTARGLEERVVPGAGIKLHHLAVRGVRGKGLLSRLVGLLYLALAAIQALVLVLRRWPRCVVGMGGYVAGPAGIAAWLLRRPLLIHEQNAIAGTTNRMLAPFASRVLAGLPAAPASQLQVELVGNPVRNELLQRSLQAAYDYTGQRPLRLLVVGGSLGARPINETVPGAVRELLERFGPSTLDVWHQSGNDHIEDVRADYADLAGDSLKLTAFIEDMAEAYAWADVVLCRAGALTVAELAIMGRPAILVPLPHAIDDHQSANARYLSEAGAGVLLLQEDLDAASLAGILARFIGQPEQLQAMARSAKSQGLPGATDAVCNYCRELIDGRG